MHIVLMVVHSGPLLFPDDLRLALPADLSLQVMQEANLSAELPPCDLVVQSGLGDGEAAKFGLELLQRLRAMAPNAPIVVCSGHDEKMLAPRVHELAKASFFHRPLAGSREEMDRFVRFLRSKIASPPVPD